MILRSATATLGLTARVTPSGTSVSGVPSIGDPVPSAVNYTTANVAYACMVAAAAAANVATLTLTSGVVAQTTGSPVITDGDGKDIEGNTFTAMAKLMALRITAPSTNTSAVSFAGSSQVVPDVDLSPGSDMVVALPVAGVTATGITLAATFATLGDSVTITVIGKTA